MSKNRIVFVVGVLVIAIPYLGFPSSWERVFFFLCGLSLLILSFAVSAQKRQKAPKLRRLTRERTSKTHSGTDETLSADIQELSEPADTFESDEVTSKNHD